MIINFLKKLLSNVILILIHLTILKTILLKLVLEIIKINIGNSNELYVSIKYIYITHYYSRYECKKLFVWYDKSETQVNFSNIKNDVLNRKKKN